MRKTHAKPVPAVMRIDRRERSAAISVKGNSGSGVRQIARG
jgi:hypothetical protein